MLPRFLRHGRIGKARFKPGSSPVQARFKPGSSPVVLQPAHWFKAHDKPPTYFPKGVPVDHPTTSRDGMWVMTGDSVGTRYFIPLRGVDTEVLSTEAMTMRTSAELEKVDEPVESDLDLQGVRPSLGEGIEFSVKGAMQLLTGEWL